MGAKAIEWGGGLLATVAIVMLGATILIACAPASAEGADGSRSVVTYGPDLAVSGADMTVSKSVLLAGVPFNLTAKVYNLGDIDALSVEVRFLVDGEQVGGETVPLVAKDGYAQVTHSFTLARGTHRLAVWADPDDSIDERREDNNGAEMSVKVQGLPDVYISSDEVTLSDPHPLEGDVVTIGATIRNKGETQASLVVVQFWDGSSSAGTLIANRTTSVAPSGWAMVSAPWDTASLGGTHTITVVAATVLPGESNPADNFAEATVLVFTQWDMVVDDATGDVVIEQMWAQDGFVTIRGGHSLTVRDVGFYFLQDYPYQFAVFVEDGATLTLEGAAMGSGVDLLVVLEGASTLRVLDQSMLQASIEASGTPSIIVRDSELTGGIIGSLALLDVDGSDVSGPFEVEGATITATQVLFDSPGPMMMSGVRAVLTDTVIIGGSETSLDLSMGSDVELHNVSCANVVTDDGSKAFVFRRVGVLVVDESALVVPGATIRVVHYINGTTVASGTGGADGKVTLEVVSDVIEEGQPHFIGNYRVLAEFDTVSSETPLLLEPFPDMEQGSNCPSMTAVLPPVEPRALVGSTEGDLVVEAGEEPFGLVADFIQDGSVVVRGALTLSSAKLTLLQDRNHQFYVLVEGEGRLELAGAQITSARDVNIYLYDSAELVLGPGSRLAVNAIVAQDQSIIRASNATLEGRLILRGGAVLLENDCAIDADMVVAECQSFDMRGGSITAEGLMTASPSVSLEDVSISVVDMSLGTGTCKLTRCSVSASTFTAQAMVLTILGSNVLTEGSAILNVSTLTVDTSLLNHRLDGLEPSAKVYLYDASIPRPFTLNECTVMVYWYLTVRAIDVLGNMVGDATVEVSFTRNDTVAAVGTTDDDGEVRLPLLGSIVDADGERFLGNYRVEVTSPVDSSDVAVYYVGLDKGRTVVAYFPEPLVPPTGVDIDVVIVNTTFVAGTPMDFSGTAIATYLVGRQPMAEGTVRAKLVGNGNIAWQNSTEVDEMGGFAFSLTAPPAVGAYTLEVEVEGAGAFEGIQGRAHAIGIDIVEPAPTRIVVVLVVSETRDFELGGNVVIKGTVRYNNAQGRPVSGARVLCKDDPTKQTRQRVADGVGAFEFTFESPPYIGQWNYMITAKDEALGLTSDEMKFTVIAIEAAQVEQQEDNRLLWGVVIAVVVAALVVGAVMAQMYFSARGKVVECGECGTLVPESALKCPKCGSEFETEVAKCSECGSWIPSKVDVCPYCATEFRKPDEDMGDEQPPGGEGAEAVAGSDVEVELEGGLAPEGAAPEGAVPVDEATAADAAKKAPEGIAGPAPRPVVQRRAVMAPKVDESVLKGAEGDARPRVRKVSKQPRQDGDGGR